MRYQILRVCDELIITEQEVTIMQLNTFIKKNECNQYKRIKSFLKIYNVEKQVKEIYFTRYID